MAQFTNFRAMSSGESEKVYMVDPKSEALVKAFEDLLAEKRVIGKKEDKLVRALNRTLRKSGYEVLPRKRRGRPRKRR